MRCSNLIVYFILLLAIPLSAAPDVSLDVCTYHSDKSGYLEVSIYVVGQTLATDAATKGDYGIQYTILIRTLEDQVVGGGKYRLVSTGYPAKDIIDARRFELPDGTYKIELEAIDLLDSLSNVTITADAVLSHEGSDRYMSGLQLLSIAKSDTATQSSLTKSGLYMEPLAFHYFYPSLTTLYVYHEIYHADELSGQPYLQYIIKPVQGDIPEPLVAYKRVKKENVAAQLYQLDIRDLISGPFEVTATLFDGDKKEMGTQKTFFSRLNPEGDSLFLETAPFQLENSFVKNIPEDSLDYFLRALAPVCNSADVEVMNMLLSHGSVKARQYFIHRYWTQRAGKQADFAFNSYMKVARVIDMTYRSGFGYGFETDMGHVFLKYGKPDDSIAVEDEPSAPPYEIWFYTHFPATHQNNVRFLFYNPSLVKNGFKLLHSTAIGEINNDRWEIELYRDATLETPGINDREMGDNVHRHARQYFEN